MLAKPDPTRNTPDFELREVKPPRAYTDRLSSVVLAERLREVTALIGFSRLESMSEYQSVDGEQIRRRAPLARKPPPLVPAGEVRGEGIFIRFNEDRIHAWCEKNIDLEQEFIRAHTEWRLRRRIPNPGDGFPGMRYVLLHTFSHALMRQLSLECGYSAASIRERIYAREEHADGGPMAGILLYTAAPDSEGTLGGLVQMAAPTEPDAPSDLGRHIEQALEQMKLCTSDPLCAEHHPEDDGTTLHGAACNACLFAPETSCERGNKYLCRALLVPALFREVVPFFGAE